MKLRKLTESLENRLTEEESAWTAGPYLYFTKHGIGPGSLPRDVELEKVQDMENFITAIWLSRPLTKKELEQYDIYPEWSDHHKKFEKELMGEAFEPDWYFGKEEAEKYGKTVLDMLDGNTVSKRKDKAEEPGGLVYEANRIGIDLWDLLATLEGLCYKGLCREIDDSTYLVGKGMNESMRINEKKWEYTLKCGNALRNAIHEEDHAEILRQILNAYEELLNAGLIDEYDYDQYTEDFELYLYDDFQDWDDPDSVVDAELANLYDLCDNINVWIPIEESLQESVSEYDPDAVYNYLSNNFDLKSLGEILAKNIIEYVQSYATDEHNMRYLYSEFFDGIGLTDDDERKMVQMSYEDYGNYGNALGVDDFKKQLDDLSIYKR